MAPPRLLPLPRPRPSLSSNTTEHTHCNLAAPVQQLVLVFRLGGGLSALIYRAPRNGRPARPGRPGPALAAQQAGPVYVETDCQPWRRRTPRLLPELPQRSEPPARQLQYGQLSTAGQQGQPGLLGYRGQYRTPPITDTWQTAWVIPAISVSSTVCTSWLSRNSNTFSGVTCTK